MRLGLCLAAIIMVAVVTGCGIGDSSTVAETSGQTRIYPWLKGPSREFLIRGGDNVVQTYGREASESEREQASRVIAAWMKARAGQDWKRDCGYLAQGYIHGLVAEDARQVTDGEVTTCPQALDYFGHLASGSYKNNLTGPIDSLRVEGGYGYAQYHGNDGHDWVIPVSREDGRWLIATATPIGRSR
jgi:hypothetical protein